MRQVSLVLGSIGFLFLSIYACIILEKQPSCFKELSLRFSPSPEAVEILSLNQKALFADLFFAHTVVHLGENYKTPEKRNLDFMYANLDIATRLDPDFRAAYFYGGMVIPLAEEETRRAIRFLEKGMQRAPLDWHLPFWLGCNYYYELGDYLRAADYFARAAKIPSSPAYLEPLRAMVYYKAAQPQTALAILESLEQSTENKAENKTLEKKVVWLRNIITLEEMVRRFNQKFGRLPESLKELISAGLLKELPEDSFGKGFFLDKNNARVKSLGVLYSHTSQKESSETGICDIHTPRNE